MRWIAMITLGLLLACSSDKTEPDTTTTTKRSVSDDSLYTLAAQRVVHEFKQELKGALMTAMKEGGLPNAIGACQSKAPEIAVKHAAPGIFSIKRVTDRNRSPENLADADELDVLARFAKSTGEQSPFIGLWSNEVDKQSYTFYEPIYVGKLCLGCHGPAESLDAEVREALRLNYPEDKATGYQAGDLRGLVVVEIRWPQGRDWAKKVTTEE